MFNHGTAIFRWDLLFTGRNGYLEYAAYETQTVWKPPLQAIASDFASNWCNSPSICQLEEVRVFFQVAWDRAIIILQIEYVRGDSVDASQMMDYYEQKKHGKLSGLACDGAVILFAVIVVLTPDGQ